MTNKVKAFQGFKYRRWIFC